MGIRQTLCLVITCALGFSWYRSLSSDLNDNFRAFGQCYDIIMGVVVGIILTGGFVLAVQQRRSHPPPMLLPGHWLFGFGLAAVLACMGLVGAYHGLIFYHGSPDGYNGYRWLLPPYWVPFQISQAPTNVGLMHQSVGWSLAAVAALAFCRATFGRLPWRWWILFPVIVLGASILAVGHLTAFVDFWGRPAAISWCHRSVDVYGMLVAACLLFIASAVVRDAWEQRRGDALHWTGVSAWLIIGTMQLALYFKF